MDIKWVYLYIHTDTHTHTEAYVIHAERQHKSAETSSKFK